jgi:ribosomal protein L32E
MRANRLIRKARKIRALVGASDDLQEPIWRKPKGMHQKTFDRLSQKDRIVSAEIDSYIARLLNRYEIATSKL